MSIFTEAPFSLFLLLVNGMVGLYSLNMDPSLVGRMAFTPSRIREHREYYRLITGGFVHAGLGHLAFNMLTLYYFGPFLELTLGSVSFLLIYFGSSLTASALSYFFHRSNANYSAVGASGAISGLVFAYCLFNPFRQLILFFVVPMPAWFFAVAFVGFSIYAMRKKFSGELGRIAHEAHLGGAIGGVLFTILVEPRAIQIFLGQIGL